MKKTKFTENELQVIGQIQEEKGISRKSAIRAFQKQKARGEHTPNYKTATAPAKDKKSAAANDVETDAQVAERNTKALAKSEPKLPAKNASAVAKGAAYHVLAGRPDKTAVIACFGKTGYALSWVARAERLGITAQELCERFSKDAASVKQLWEKSQEAAK